MSAIAGSVSLSATSKARGMSFKSSAPMGTRVSSAAVVPVQPKKAQRRALKVVAGNTNEGGLFAPLVILARNIIGVKPFNKIRGKAIALHSQVKTRGRGSSPLPPHPSFHCNKKKLTTSPPRGYEYIQYNQPTRVERK